MSGRPVKLTLAPPSLERVERAPRLGCPDLSAAGFANNLTIESSGSRQARLLGRKPEEQALLPSHLPLKERVYSKCNHVGPCTLTAVLKP